MTRLSSPPGDTCAAEDAARVAAECGVEVTTLDDMAVIAEAVTVFRTIWGSAPGAAPVTGELLKAVRYAGGYVAGAIRKGVLVGASAGFLGSHDSEMHLHSHITGVLPSAQGANVGLAMKLHQRAWALERGMSAVEWTFDPLVRRNAYFNLVKLGATIVGYEPEFYGSMRDAINDGDETDRAVVRWSLESDRAVDAACGAPVDDARDAPALLLADDNGDPHTALAALDARPAAVRAHIPADIVELRRSDIGRALRWRRAVRDTMGAAIGNGYVGTSMTRDGWYTLLRED